MPWKKQQSPNNGGPRRNGQREDSTPKNPSAEAGQTSSVAPSSNPPKGDEVKTPIGAGTAAPEGDDMPETRIPAGEAPVPNPAPSSSGSDGAKVFGGAGATAATPRPATAPETPTKPRGFDSTSLPRTAAEAPPSIISQGMEISGTIRCRGPLQLEGALEGSISCPDLAIGPTGVIVGDIEARELRVEGDVQGSIQCDTLDMGKTASMDGLLECRSLVLANGARLTGDIRIG